MSDQTYNINFAPTAAADLAETLTSLEAEAPQEVREWYATIKPHIKTLERLPKRCPLSAENKLWGNEPIRQLLFMGYPSKYRILFTINEQQVQILNIRHGARRWMHEDN